MLGWASVSHRIRRQPLIPTPPFFQPGSRRRRVSSEDLVVEDNLTDG